MWIVTYKGSDLFALAPTEPYLTILESLILISAPVLVFLMLSIHVVAPVEKRFFSLGAVVFMSIMTAITCCVHFGQLSVVRHSLAGEMPGMRMYIPHGQLSLWIALDMLAWTFFYGGSLLLASQVFYGDRLQRTIRFVLMAGGLLCVFGVSGPLSGNLIFYLSAPFGFTLSTLAGCVFLHRWFKKQNE